MSQRLAYLIIFMFASPALSLYKGLQSRSDQVKRWTLILFITIFGSVIQLDEGHDGYRVLKNVYDHYMDLSFEQFALETYDILTLNPSLEIQEEPFAHFISYFVGGILGLPELFFPIIAFIYAYFFSGSLFRLFRIFPKWKYSILFFGFGLIFLLWKNIEGINTVRTWNGMWVLFYACISYYQTRHWKYALLMFAPPFIHIGFSVMALPAWIILVFGVHRWVYIIIFAMSFGIAGLNPTGVANALQQTSVGQAKVKSYYREDPASLAETLDKHQNSAWYLKANKIGLHHMAVTLIAMILIFSGAYFKAMTPIESSLFSIGLLTKALANYSWFLYALANRSTIIAGVFILATLLLMWQRGYFAQFRPRRKFEELGLHIALLLLVPFFIFRIADIIYFLSVFMLFGPFVPWVSADANLSIRQAIGLLLGR